MSYCRFSSDDWRCDLYVYESCNGGFVTHVASNKTRGYVPRLLPMPPYSWKSSGSLLRRIQFAVQSRLFWWSYKLQSWYVEVMPRRSLGLPFDGESFTDCDAEACATRVRLLIAAGYSVPAVVVPALEAEAAESVARPLLEEVPA